MLCNKVLESDIGVLNVNWSIGNKNTSQTFMNIFAKYPYKLLKVDKYYNLEATDMSR
jgi:hypothetical protein